MLLRCASLKRFSHSKFNLISQYFIVIPNSIIIAIITMRSPFCMPRMKAGSRWTRKSNRLTPMSLLDRFREAVFRLIMLSALSKAAACSTAAREAKYSEAASQKPAYYYNVYEPHHSEAVADCIEFIKTSAIAEDNGSSIGSCSIDDDDDVVRPLPVL